MKYVVVYHSGIEKDVKDAKNWYKEQLEGLDKRFALSVKEAISYIVENPLLFEEKYKETRVSFCRVFPYGVHYHFNVKSKTITIMAVLHTSADFKNIKY